jgi:hypothetical protein
VQIESAVSQPSTHSYLLKAGFVGLLKGFLEPLETSKEGRSGKVMTLPHIKVRSTVYQALKKLPISTHEQEGRDIIRSSEIGPVLRFYSKVKHESQANRLTVSQLLNTWMLPIIEEGRKAVRDEEVERQKLEVRIELICVTRKCASEKLFLSAVVSIRLLHTSIKGMYIT